MSQHTPGPWVCDGISEYTGEMLVRCAAEGVNKGDVVARICCYGPQSETPFAQQHNAQLVKEAPNMLATLQAIVDEAGPQFGHDDGPGCINRIARLARLAIASATKDQ